MNNYKDPEFIKNHAIQLIDFYKPRVKDDEYGGYYCAYLDNGEIYNKSIKDLISTTRFILNFSFGVFLGGPADEYKDYIRHGLEFLEIIHRDEINGGYHQIADKNIPVIGNKITYGQSFCLCAVSNAYKAGVKEAYPIIGRIYDLLEEKLWEPEYKLYSDESSNDFKNLTSIRGQNCNMHMVEAMIAAYEATGEQKYIDRAYEIAYQVTKNLSSQSNGFIWEHFDSDWKIDWEFGKDDPKNLYKPYGFVAGHFTEWSKLLLILERYKSADWQLKASESLFKKAIEYAWDDKKGGLNYTFDKHGKILDDGRYYWSHAETIAAAALLALRTGNVEYWNIYQKCWNYSEKYLYDDKYGGWHRIISKDRQPLSDKKSPPGKTDYHIIGACQEILKAMQYHNIIN